ncbi:MAG TPA: DUF1707 domain-containing protein [Pseudonocardiaceae bacterium]|nr:DUF1707 domain-containing protein [Pseudonocardiaceae bacterium]
MADLQPSQIRIGDTERESALAALGEHMSAGRLDIDEYGDRTARVSAAKTRGELNALFTDLPGPHPTFGTPMAAPTPPPAVPQPQGMQVPMRHRLAAAAVPLAGIIAVALFFAVHWWVVFLIPAAVAVFGGALWGDEWKHQKRMSRDRYRQERRQIRRQRYW